jgi:hypothetical protein
MAAVSSRIRASEFPPRISAARLRRQETKRGRRSPYFSGARFDTAGMMVDTGGGLKWRTLSPPKFGHEIQHPATHKTRAFARHSRRRAVTSCDDNFVDGSGGDYVRCDFPDCRPASSTVRQRRFDRSAVVKHRL